MTAPAGSSLYLFGTVHTGGRELVAPVAWNALAASSTFVMETDLSGLDEDAMLARAVLPAGESLRQILGEPSWAQLTATLTTIPAAGLDRLRPWFVTTRLMQQLMPSGDAVDEVLAAQADASGMARGFLEPLDTQLGIIEQAFDTDGLRQMLSDLDGTRAALDELVVAYRRGDADGILALTSDPRAMSAAQADLILLDRNRTWLPTLEAYLARGDTFVAVGAAHLPGAGGVLDLLDQRGYAVERVSDTAAR